MSSKKVFFYDETVNLGDSKYEQSIFLYRGNFIPNVKIKRILNENRLLKGEIEFSCLNHPYVVKLLHSAQETLYTYVYLNHKIICFIDIYLIIIFDDAGIMHLNFVWDP